MISITARGKPQRKVYTESSDRIPNLKAEYRQEDAQETRTKIER